MGRIKRWIEDNEWLLACLVVVVLLRIPSLLEPYWYGDEGIYLTLGQAVNKGLRLYRDIHDNKPPFIYWLAALAGGRLFWLKMITMIWNLATISWFAKFTGEIFKKKPGAAKIATWIFALLSTLPWLEGNIANAELFFLLPAIAAAYYLLTEKQTRTVFSAGLLLGLGGLFKMPVLLEAGVWPLLWLATGDKLAWKKILILGLGVMLPLVICSGYYVVTGAGREYFRAAWAQNLPYLTSWKSTGTGSGIYNLKTRAAITGAVIALVWLAAKKADKKTVFLGFWGAVVWFAALMSGRPYPHYLLQALPAATIFGVWLLAGKKQERAISLGWWVLTGVTLFYFKFYHYPVWDYYKNFGLYLAHKRGFNEYATWFNPQIQVNYLLAAEAAAGSTEEERIFVWGDEPMIYALSRRLPAVKYAALYHVKSFGAEKETIDGLYKARPKLVIVFNPTGELPGLQELLNREYFRYKEIGNGTIYRLIGMND